MQRCSVPVTVRVISAGKFRRYVHLSFWQHFTVPHVVTRNVTDLFKIGWGVAQSIGLMLRFRPDVIFAKGGFVCLPVGIAGRLLRIPLVIHDSDTRAGLTNRILSRWATKIATGSPLENYSYDPRRSVYTGVPIDDAFTPKTPEQQRALKEKIGIDPSKLLVVATGGGLGARSINYALVRCGQALIEQENLAIYHVTGKGNYEEARQAAPTSPSYKLVPFVYEDMAAVLGAADIVVSRGSATTLQELAGLKKAVIIVPAHQLGDQVKNAEMYDTAGAGMIIDNHALESNPDILRDAIRTLAQNEALREQFAEALHVFARPNAAADLAQLITTTAKR